MEKNCGTSFIGFFGSFAFPAKGQGTVLSQRLFLDLFETKIRGCGYYNYESKNLASQICVIATLRELQPQL